MFTKKYYCFLKEYALKILKIIPNIKPQITKLHDPKTKSPFIHRLFKSIPQSNGHHMLQVVRLKNIAKIDPKKPIPNAKYRLVIRTSQE